MTSERLDNQSRFSISSTDELPYQFPSKRSCKFVMFPNSEGMFPTREPRKFGYGSIERHFGKAEMPELRHGTIPNFIGSMTQLRHLDLSHNDFNGTIPKSIGSLTQLRYLDVSVNFLHGNIPPEFGNLISLRNLSLGPSYGGIISVDPIDYIIN
ncbi:hypothetical protein OSB04_011180 [Centaurea solstitialis]|uniref:Uncharacterized protein n=1 Tax=Centaurea solstitialis TaxID=347529 RepID=A0AA38WPW7_9ASTR|nr:hypothetical protein OSB04_011180 [Centaurea solstitialis]